MAPAEGEPQPRSATRVIAGALVALVVLAALMVGTAEVSLRRSGSTDAQRTAENGTSELADAEMTERDGGCPLELTDTSFDRPTRTAMCLVQDGSTASPQHTAVALGNNGADLVVCVMLHQPSTGVLSFLFDNDVQTAVSTAPMPDTLRLQRAEELPLGDGHDWAWCPRD